MISRVGNVLYWVAVVVALLWGNGFFLFLKPENPVVFSIIGMVAIYLVGLAIKSASEAVGRLWVR